MKKNLIALCFCLVLIACANEKNIIPENVLPINKMAEVMADINLQEASLGQNINTGIKVDTTKATIDFEVFKKHNITKKQYQESFDFYTMHLDSLNKIYELVLTNLSKVQAEAMSRK